jgi:hypothetical protein
MAGLNLVSTEELSRYRTSEADFVLEVTRQKPIQFFDDLLLCRTPVYISTWWLTNQNVLGLVIDSKPTRIII